MSLLCILCLFRSFAPLIHFCFAALRSFSVYWNYYPAFNNYTGGVLVVNGFQQPGEKPTAGIFATYPADFINNGNGFVSEMLGTAILLFVIFASGDAKNAAPTACG